MVYKIFYYQSEQHPHAIGGKVGPVACAVGGQICLSQLYHATHQNGRHHTYQGQAALVPFIAVALVFEPEHAACAKIHGQMHNLVDIRNVVKRAHMRRTEQTQIPYQRHTCQCDRKVFS